MTQRLDLCELIELGDLDGVQWYCSFHRVDRDRCQPIPLAVRSSHWDIVEYLLDKGEDPNQEDARGVPAICLAAQNGLPHGVSLLLSHGADPNASCDMGTPLSLAAGSNLRSARKVAMLIQAGARPNIPAKQDGDIHQTTALQAAVSAANLDSCNVLLASGADPNLRPAYSVSALSLAARQAGSGDAGSGFRLGRSLLAEGADPNEYGGFSTWLPVTPGAEEFAIMLLNAGANVYWIDALHGWTALHYAAYLNQSKLASALLDAGANPLTTDERGMTAKQISVEYQPRAKELHKRLAIAEEQWLVALSQKEPKVDRRKPLSGPLVLRVRAEITSHFERLSRVA